MAKANKVYRFSFKEEDLGVVGVGTLIVFIAMILVAAIAAAVIIKTAYSLKNQAERVGEEATVEATGPPQIISVVGDRGAAINTNIQTLFILVTTFVPSSAINISMMKIEVVTGSAYAVLGFTTTAPAPTGLFNASQEKDPPDTEWTNAYMLDDDDVVKLYINLNPLDTGMTATLPPGTYLSFKLIPEHGPVVTEEVRTPTNYGSDRYIDLTSY